MRYSWSSFAGHLADNLHPKLISPTNVTGQTAYQILWWALRHRDVWTQACPKGLFQSVTETPPHLHNCLHNCYKGGVLQSGVCTLKRHLGYREDRYSKRRQTGNTTWPCKRLWLKKKNTSGFSLG